MTDTWGDAYKIVTKELKCMQPPYKRTPEMELKIIEILFLRRKDVWRRLRSTGQDAPEITADEVRSSAKKLKTGKTQGRTASRQKPLRDWLSKLHNTWLTCSTPCKRIWNSRRLENNPG